MLRGFLLALTMFMGWAICAQNDTISKDESIDIEKINKRTLPGTHVFSLLGVGNRNLLVLDNPTLLFKGRYNYRRVNRIQLVDAVYFNYAYILSSKLFFEAGFRYVNHFTTFTINPVVVKYGLRQDAHSNFATLSFNVGSGYRVIDAKNRNWVTLLYGLNFGIVDMDTEKGTESFYSIYEPYENINGELDYLYIESLRETIRRTYFGAYLGVSKDIRITRNLYATIRFHYQFAPFQRLTKHTIYYSLPSYNTEQELTGGLSASGFMYGFGFSWFFGE